MIFSLVSSAQEWLNVRWDDHKKEVELRAEEKLKEYEEAERVIKIIIMYLFSILTCVGFFSRTETFRGHSRYGRIVSGVA